MEYKKIIDVIEKPQSGEWGKDDETGDGIPVLRTTNFTDVGEVNYSNVVTRCIDPKKIEKKALKKGDIIIEKSGGSDTKPVGRVIYFDGEDNKYLFNNFTSVLRVKENIEMQNKYLFYYLFHFYRKKGTVRYENKTTGLHNLKLDQMVNDVSVPIIMKEEQEKFCEILDKVYGCIKLRKEELVHYDNLIKSRFVEMFGDPVENTMNWKMCKLSDLSVQINSGNTPKGGEQVYVDKGITFFRSQNVWKDRLEMDDVAFIDKETHESMKRSSLKHGDILITKTGRINTENSSLGRAALYLGEDDAANVNGHVYFIRLKPEVNNEFILKILVSKEYLGYIRSVCVGGIDKRQLNKNHIEDFPIICPPKDMQNKFIDFVKQVDKLKFKVQKFLDAI